ncbi:lipoprotein [Pseudomonas sp. M47T1]|nr:lipoprotein [Pseudomonas sp. M47T1]
MLVLALAGCDATMSRHEVKGIATLHINCSGLTSSWDKCYEKAEDACGVAGYSVVAKSTDLQDDTPDYPFGINPAGMSSRSLVVRCKDT